MSETAGCLKGREDLSVAYLVSNLGFGLNMSALQNQFVQQAKKLHMNEKAVSHFLHL